MHRRWLCNLVLFAIVVVAGMPRCNTAREPIDVPQPTDWALLPEPLRLPIREAVERCIEDPRDPRAFETLGRIYHGNEHPALAAACYRRAIELGSREARTYYLLGLIRRQSGDVDAAIDLLREAAELEPRYAPTRHNLGQALLDGGRIEEAIPQFERAIEIDADDPAFHAALGRALRQAGRPEQAEAALRGGLALAPDDGELHQLLGLTLKALGRQEEARAHLDRLRRQFDSVVSDPWLLEVQRHAASSKILLDRARTLLDRGRLESALELLDELSKRYPDVAAVFRLVGKARLRAGQPQAALRAYIRATDLEPHDAEAHAELALLLSRHGKIEDAEHEAELALAADPQHALAAVVKAGMAVRRGRPREALETLRPVLERRADLMAAHVVHGEALYALGAAEQAAAAFERALELAPRTDYVRQRLERTRQELAASGAP